MDLDELRGVQSTERQRDSLQHLRDSFYEDVATYIAGRKHRRDDRASSVENPFSDDQVRKLSDEIETAEEVVESLYERRVGKVVKLASFAAADAPVETEGMTAEETDLFDDLVARIEANKDTVLEVLSGGSDVDLEAPDGAEPSPTASGSEADDIAGSVTESAGEADPDGSRPDPAAKNEGGLLADAMGAETDSTGERARGGADESPADSESETLESETAPQTPPEELETSRGARGAPPNTGGTDGDVSTTDDAPGMDDERTTVRITRDVGEILGVDDREYELETEDVVTLPTANADPLVERDAAEPLE